MSEKVLGISERKINSFIKEFEKELRKTGNQIYVPKKQVLEAFIEVFKSINEEHIVSLNWLEEFCKKHGTDVQFELSTIQVSKLLDKACKQSKEKK